ncbi:hypothetical protein [Pseudobutyrivibrio xylanivorans]|uniref:Uncharacterized protein n=1 Tax=Pseudobutyrivibrio xylanivorans DSM 14809 TaxID=1123012 RepID=A0A1M6JV33_PSEXY|nr:hypothetical protein [Pseudobutyrivibrio xylanivorans]SHJ50584.1 hypothetical protein SAMN02745725_02693 [Pseudobutyrivibrio xylanivorans DSM 14809]
MDAKKAWENVILHEGETFKTVSGLEFTYTMSREKNSFKTSRTNYSLGKTNFEKACALMPAENTKFLSDNGVRGQAYVFALLTDPRIV